MTDNATSFPVPPLPPWLANLSGWLGLVAAAAFVWIVFRNE